MPRWPGFIGGSNTSQSLIGDAERTVNMYVESLQAQAAANAAALYPTPGYQAWSTAVTYTGARGAAVANGRCFFVMAGELIEYSTTGVPTDRGSVAQDGNPAQIIYNGVVGGQLGICTGGNVYSYDLATNVLTAALLTGGYTHIGFVDGYGLAFNPTTGKVNLSNLNNLGTWGAGNFFQRSKFPDPWQAMFVDSNGLIWLPGTETFEAWYDTGAGTQPFAPLSGLFGRFGIAAPFAYATTSQGLFWLATSADGGLQVVTTKGGLPDPVSTYAVNAVMAQFLRYGPATAISNAEMLPYFEQGHTFINLSFPSAPVSVPFAPTWTYDAEGRAWAERGRWDAPTGRYDLWSPRAHCYFNGKHLVGDRTTGTIYWMDTTFSTEIDGTAIRRMRRTPALLNEYKRVPIDTVQLLLDVGITGQGAAPITTMRLSGDGGRTWGNEQQAGMGRIGEYRTRVFWNRLGADPDTVMECVWTNTSPTRVIDAYVNNTEDVSGRAA